MKKAILATKVGMTQIFNEDGVLTPVTVLQAGPCVVTQVKTQDNDGYSAVQVGFADKREKLVNKPVKGHFDKAGVSYKRFVREFKLEGAEEMALGQEIKCDVFAAGDKDDIWEIRPYVLHCKGQDPMKDEWEELGMMQAADEDEFSFHAFSLDATVFEHKGEYYYIWAEKTVVGKQISILYISKIESTNKLATVQVL